MLGLALDKLDGENFTAVHLGKWTDLDKYSFKTPKLPRPYPGKLFLKTELKLTGMEVSLNKLPPGTQMPFHHKHQENEELYLFIKGKGQFQIDGKIVDVHEGTAIRVGPEGVRIWRNNSSEDLFFVVIQAKAESLFGEDISDGIGIEQSVEWPDPGTKEKD
jgi:mannose-6-phosphate isomerase-like protein (cupin superfamily)